MSVRLETGRTETTAQSCDSTSRKTKRRSPLAGGKTLLREASDVGERLRPPPLTLTRFRPRALRFRQISCSHSRSFTSALLALITASEELLRSPFRRSEV